MNWETVSVIFEQATEREGASREAYLQQIQSEYPAEYAEVLSLLAEDESLYPIFAPETTNLWDTMYDLAWEGKVIGNYQLISHLGSGGMGAVLLAKRVDGEFDQTVALKVLRPGKWSEKLADHFREERQILASLQHPNIARLLDGGVAEDGSLYFTMEYVDGEPITDYCFNHKLNISEKLQLIQQVCQAIEYAHKNLIVHLDLKPSNILVNAEGQVKLLDFGIAQALQDTEKEGAQFFTKNYASPEQLRQERLTTASDIYSLGLIFKELLLENSADFQDLNVSFSDDLKAIFLKATAEQPGERYAAASEMANDLAAYLNNYPVRARKRTAGYVLHKGWRRNRVLVSAMGIALLSIVFLTGFYTLRLQHEKAVAEREAARANQISDYLISIFTLADPNETPASEFTVQQLLASSSADLQEKLKNQPDILADIYQALSSVYVGLGLYESADSLGQLALDLKYQLYQPPHEAIVSSLVNLGSNALGGGLYEKADSCLRQAYEMTLKLPGDQKLNIADRQFGLGDLMYENGDFLTADSLYKIALATYQKELQSPHEKLANVLLLLGATQRKMGNFDVSEQYYTESLQMREQLYKSPDSELAYIQNHLASLYFDQGHYDRAIGYARESLIQRQQVFGINNNETLYSQANLARIYRAAGVRDSSIQLYRDAIEKFEETYGETHPSLGGLTVSLAGVYLEDEQLELAKVYYQRAISILTRLLPPEHPNLAFVYNGFGAVAYKEGKYAEALPNMQRALDIREATLPPTNPLLALSRFAVGRCLVKMGRNADAGVLLQKAYDVLSKLPEKYEQELQEIEEMLQE